MSNTDFFPCKKCALKSKESIISEINNKRLLKYSFSSFSTQTNINSFSLLENLNPTVIDKLVLDIKLFLDSNLEIL